MLCLIYHSSHDHNWQPIFFTTSTTSVLVAEEDGIPVVIMTLVPEKQKRVSMPLWGLWDMVNGKSSLLSNYIRVNPLENNG